MSQHRLVANILVQFFISTHHQRWWTLTLDEIPYTAFRRRLRSSDQLAGCYEKSDWERFELERGITGQWISRRSYFNSIKMINPVIIISLVTFSGAVITCHII